MNLQTSQMLLGNPVLLGMDAGQIFAFALGIFSIVKGILAHIAYSQFAKNLKADFVHYSWDRENPISERKWNDKGEPSPVTESRVLWNQTKINRDSTEDRRNFYFLIALFCFGIFLNTLRA
jgi:hypothetical protein